MIPEDQARFMAGMGLTTLLSFLLRYLPSESAKMYYSLAFSLCLQFYTYGTPTLLPLSLHVFMYYFIKSVKREQCGVLSMVTSILFVSVYYIYVMIVDFGRFELDVSTTLMMSVCKYSLFAFSYQDGIPNEKEQSQQRLKEKLQVLPSFFQFFNYMTFLPTCLINTPFQYSMFRSYIRKQEQFADIPLTKIFKKVGKEIFIMVICFSLYILGLMYVPASAMTEQNYASQGFLHHAWYSYASIHLYKYRFYVGFVIMQIPVYAAGLAYDPAKGGDQFKGIQTVEIYKNETAYHLRDKVGSWNMAVQEWLRKCVYERLPYGKQKNQLITFMVSAFWHGFYPGLYISFFLYFLQVFLGGVIYKFSREFKDHWLIQFYNNTQKYSFYFCWFVWNWIIANNSAYFITLTAQKSYRILSMMRFSNPIFLISLFIFFMAIKPKKQQKDKKS